MLRRLIRALQALARGFAVVQLAIVFGAVFLVLAPPLTLVRLVRRPSAGWHPVTEDTTAEGLRHGS